MRGGAMAALRAAADNVRTHLAVQRSRSARCRPALSPGSPTTC
jgi:hypothetical protein